LFLTKVQMHKDMTDWYAKRTNMHIKLVQKYLRKILDLNLPEIDGNLLLVEMDHDIGKWVEPEYEPYVHITWRYHQERLGKEYKVPEGIEEKMQEATFHHIKHHRHHPEYWDDNVEISCLNTQDRDKPSENMVDATSMPLTYIGSLMADWLAMSEEKNTDVNDWIKNNVNVRWSFTPEQVELMKRIAQSVVTDRG
jgi:hypothetical protein